jgi:general secretion pathway protein L
MSVLVILLPARPRAAAPWTPPADYAFVLSADGQSVAQQGRAAARSLPRATSVHVLLPECDLAWQRVAVPRAPAAKLRAALGAVLEDDLLEDDEQLHLALEPGLVPGQTGWVAVTHKAWLVQVLADLAQAGVTVDRVQPTTAPQAAQSPVRVHALPTPDHDDDATVVWADAGGVLCARLSGGLARQRLASVDRSALISSAHPAAVAAMEHLLEAPVTVLAEAERALIASRSDWNLRQFDLATRHRGLVAVRDGLRQWQQPSWRPVRIGLALLLLVQVLGLNAWAWQLDRRVNDKRAEMNRLLQSTYPQVRSVLDAPLQMQRETELLRASAGQPGSGDLEPLLAATALAWPDARPPLQALQFEPGRLTLTPTDWDDAQHAAFADRLRSAGYSAERDGAQVVIRHGARS